MPVPRWTGPRPFANLREFCTWWKYERNYYTCCLAATEEELEQDPELFDCEACEVAHRLEELWPENHEVWALFQRCVTRFAVDTHSTGLVLTAACAGLDADDTLDRMERFALIYNVLYPPEKK